MLIELSDEVLEFIEFTIEEFFEPVNNPFEKVFPALPVYREFFLVSALVEPSAFVELNTLPTPFEFVPETDALPEVPETLTPPN